MRLEFIKGNTAYIETHRKMIESTIPVYFLSAKDILLFDTGLDTEEDLPDFLENKGLKVRAILCSHLHYDHVAANQTLIQRHGAEVIVSAAEMETKHEFLRPTYPVTTISANVHSLNIDSTVIQVIPTPGHTPGHISFITPDSVCYLGDAMMAHDALLYAKLPYMEDIDTAISTMDKIAKMDSRYYVFAHKGVLLKSRIPDVIARNTQLLLIIKNLARDVMERSRTKEAAINEIIRAAGVQNARGRKLEFAQYAAQSCIDAVENLR